MSEDCPDAPLKVALEQARVQARLRPVDECLDSCLQFIEWVQIAKTQEERQAQSYTIFQEENVDGRIAESGGSAGRAQCVAQPQVVSQDSPFIPVMEVEDRAEFIPQLRAHVASLQAERPRVIPTQTTRRKSEPWHVHLPIWCRSQSGESLHTATVPSGNLCLGSLLQSVLR